MLSLKELRKAVKRETAAAKRSGDTLPDARACKMTRYASGMVIETLEVPMSEEERQSELNGILERAGERGESQEGSSYGPYFQTSNEFGLGGPFTAEDLSFSGLDDHPEPLPEPMPDDDESANERESMDNGALLRAMALRALTIMEAPAVSSSSCGGCTSGGDICCLECDNEQLFCGDCIVSRHQFLPFHQLQRWNHAYFEKITLYSCGLILNMNHGPNLCPYVHHASGPQDMTVMDVNGIHHVSVGWCRCLNAPSFPEQLFARRLFPASIQRPKTAFTFRSLKLFHMLNHVARTTPWDFTGTMKRLTDNVDVKGSPSVYKQFNAVQRHWRIVRAKRRFGHIDPNIVESNGSLVLPCVSCPLPGINLMENWDQEPNSHLVNTIFIGGDGSFRLMRNNKGGGEATDPTLFGDQSFYAPNDSYKEFSRIRGGAPDDQSDITCRGLRAGNPARVLHGHKKPCSGCICVSCIRSGAFSANGTVDLAKGERFVNFDFALIQVLRQCIQTGIRRVVVSYDIACKYHIHFMKRIVDPSWPLVTQDEWEALQKIELILLVPKFHLAAHIEGCADRFSFNWTKDVGRTCGESVESNWASLNGLATSTREMGFGHRRDTLVDAMGDWNWRKAVNEASRSLIHYKEMVKHYKKKRQVLQDLEAALDPTLLTKMREESEEGDGTQYRPKVVEYPSRLQVLKAIQREEVGENTTEKRRKNPRASGVRSARLTGSVGINMGLDLEMRQQNLRVKVATNRTDTDLQRQSLAEARRKLSKSLDTWFESLPDFLPADALQEAPRHDTSPDKERLQLPSDFSAEARERLGLISLARIEYQLRCGQLYDILERLRGALGLKSFLIRRKYRLASGQGALLRSETEIDRAGRQVRKWKEVYQRGWRALKELEGSQGTLADDDQGKPLLELRESDCVMLSDWLDDHRFWRQEGEMAEAAAGSKGGGRKELPWFWKMQFKAPDHRDDEVGEVVANWANDVVRIEWLHARASMEIFKEEVCLVKAESSRVGKTFRHLAAEWEHRAEDWEKKEMFGEEKLQAGAVAASWRRNSIFTRLAERAEWHHSQLLIHERYELEGWDRTWNVHLYQYNYRK